MDHIESCFDLSNPGPCLTLGVNQNIVFTQNVFFSVFRPVLRLIEGSKDVLVLCSQMFNEKTIIFLRLMTKPKYRYIVEVKIVGNDDTSRSFQGEPIPFGMGIDVAMKNGFTLEFSQETLENITRVQKDPITEYKLHLELTLLKQIKLGRKEIEVKWSNNLTSLSMHTNVPILFSSYLYVTFTFFNQFIIECLVFSSKLKTLYWINRCLNLQAFLLDFFVTFTQFFLLSYARRVMLLSSLRCHGKETQVYNIYDSWLKHFPLANWHWPITKYIKIIFKFHLPMGYFDFS